MADSITIKAGEMINGEFTVKQNKRNKRDLDLEIKYDFEGELMSSSATHEYRMR